MLWHFLAHSSFPLHGHDMLFLTFFILIPLVSLSENLPFDCPHKDPIFMTCVCMLRAISLVWKILYNTHDLEFCQTFDFSLAADHRVHEFGHEHDLMTLR